MNLVIDVGNTLHKIAVFSEGNMLYCQSFPAISEKTLASIFDVYPVDFSIISSVLDCDAHYAGYLEKRTKRIPFSHQTPLPITIMYKNAKTLGLDRIANAVGAAAQYPNRNLLSIQAGTCLVLDFINENGAYLGGSISPGLKMRFDTLHEKTKKLPLLSAIETNPSFLGTDSEESILSGVMVGICKEIDGFIEDYKKEFDDPVVLFSGGDAPCLQKLIKNTIFAAPNIVLKGLNEIINYNV